MYQEVSHDMSKLSLLEGVDYWMVGLRTLSDSLGNLALNLPGLEQPEFHWCKVGWWVVWTE